MHCLCSAQSKTKLGSQQEFSHINTRKKNKLIFTNDTLFSGLGIYLSIQDAIGL
jgi:hypothetical protein